MTGRDLFWRPWGAVASGGVVAFFILLSSSSWAGQSDAQHFRVGVGLRTLYDVEIKDANVAFSLWSNEIASQNGVVASSETYQDSTVLLRDFRARRVDLAIMKTRDYLQLFHGQAPYDERIATVRGGKKTQRYLLLVRADSSVGRVGDLKQRRIGRINWDESGAIYLEMMLARHGLGHPEGFFSRLEDVARPSQVIMGVFFGHLDACLVNDTAYDIAASLNPQLRTRLRAIAESEELLLGLGVLHREYPSDAKARVLNNILNLKNYARGQQILTLFKSERFDRLSEPELGPSLALLKEHDRLRRTKGFD